MTRSDGEVARASDLAWVDHDGRVTVMRLAGPGDPALVLTDVAASIWRALGEVASHDGLLARLAREYDAAPAEIESDVDEWMRSAEQARIIVRAPRQAP